MKFENKLVLIIEETLLEEYELFDIYERFLISDYDDYDRFIIESFLSKIKIPFKKKNGPQTVNEFLQVLNSKSYLNFIKFADKYSDPNNKTFVMKKDFIINDPSADMISYQKLLTGIKKLRTEKSSEYAGSEEEYKTSPYIIKTQKNI